MSISPVHGNYTTEAESNASDSKPQAKPLVCGKERLMNIRVKCTNKALPNYGEVSNFATVKDYLMYDMAGFDVLREDKDLPPLTEAQVDKVAAYVMAHYKPLQSGDFSVDSEDGSYEEFTEGDGSFQDFYNFVSDVWFKADWLDKRAGEILDAIDEALDK